MPEADRLGRWCLRCGAGMESPQEGARGCASCAGRWLGRRGTVRLAPYQAPEWSDALRRVKFAGDRSAARAIGNALAKQWLSAAQRGLAPEPSSVSAIVPVPMPAPRRIERGIDHAQCIARECAHALRVPLVAMLQQRHGIQQHFLGMRERGIRCHGMRMRMRALDACSPDAARDWAWRAAHTLELRAFRRRLRSGAEHIVLVDDVLTTGATAEECIAALQGTLRPRPQIWLLVACVTERSAFIGHGRGTIVRKL